jgi:hypothetical protein
MLKLPGFFVIAAATLSPLAWLALQGELPLKVAEPTASIAVPSELPRHFEMASIPNQTTTRILGLDQAKRFSFWALILRSRKQACDVVVRAWYAGVADSGHDQWSVACRDGNQYSISVERDAKNSVCVGNAFNRSAAW